MAHLIAITEYLSDNDHDGEGSADQVALRCIV